jgi:hypothetical protein
MTNLVVNMENYTSTWIFLLMIIYVILLSAKYMVVHDGRLVRILLGCARGNSYQCGTT